MFFYVGFGSTCECYEYCAVRVFVGPSQKQISEKSLEDLGIYCMGCIVYIYCTVYIVSGLEVTLAYLLVPDIFYALTAL